MLALTFLIALGILELGFFVVGPALQKSASMNAANIFYVLLRVVTILIFSYLVRRNWRNLFGALSLTGFLIFWDQVFFKTLWLLSQMKHNPSAWHGMTTQIAIYNSALSYLISLPEVILLAFIGAMIATVTSKKAAR